MNLALSTQVYALLTTQILEYCEYHKGDPLLTTGSESQDGTSTNVSEWDQRFISVDQEMFFEIILAANYLDIKPLLLVLVNMIL